MSTILKAADLLAEEAAPVLVDKDDNLDYDLGNLSAYEPVSIQAKSSEMEEVLMSTSRSNAQLLFNQIYSLPTESLPHEMGKLVVLPSPSTSLPREKPIPKAAAATRWEQFAKLKGIQKKKRGRMVFDESTQSWAPRFGYKSAKSVQQDAEWAVEAGGSEMTGAEDPWTRAQQEKKERIAKNKKQQDRNILRSAEKGSKNRVEGAIDLKSAIEYTKSKLGAPKKGSKKKEAFEAKKNTHHVDLALSVAQRSTASMGKFDNLRRHESAIDHAPKSSVNKSQRREASERTKMKGKEKHAAIDVLGKVLKGQKDNDNYGATSVNKDKIKSMGQQQNENKNIDKKRKAASSSSKKNNKKQKK